MQSDPNAIGNSQPHSGCGLRTRFYAALALQRKPLRTKLIAFTDASWSQGSGDTTDLHHPFVLPSRDFYAAVPLSIAIPRWFLMLPPRETLAIPGHDDLKIQVTDDQSRTLIDPHRQVAYHSGSGAAAETRQVYLINSGVQARLHSGEPTSVLEIGLGTGLGMLMTVDAAIDSQTPLRFESVESRVLERDVLDRLRLEEQLRHRWLVSRFLDWRDSLGNTIKPGRYRWDAQPDQPFCLAVGDARAMTFDAAHTYHAIYFDPFAPAVNPELWETGFLRTMRGLLIRGGILTTYCVSRPVRERFAAAGFSVRRVRGPVGGKREVLIATAD